MDVEAHQTVILRDLVSDHLDLPRKSGQDLIEELVVQNWTVDVDLTRTSELSIGQFSVLIGNGTPQFEYRLCQVIEQAEALSYRKKLHNKIGFD